MGEKVLVVEDEPTLLETLEYNLSRQGYQVLTQPTHRVRPDAGNLHHAQRQADGGLYHGPVWVNWEWGPGKPGLGIPRQEYAMSKRRVLFLCTGNSARSQMAEALVNAFLGDTWEAYSAGTAPAAQVHPLAVQAMAEVGLDISTQQPKHLEVFRGQDFDQVITLCDSAASQCPFWLGRGRQVHMGFPDPAAATGPEAERLALFRQVRDDIREQVLTYLRRVEAEGNGKPSLHL